MKLSTHLIMQVLVILGQAAVAWEQVIPEKYRVPFHLTLSSIQTIVGLLIAHNYNPDGTPAKEPYEPDAPKPGIFGQITKSVAIAFLCSAMLITQAACTQKELQAVKTSMQAANTQAHTANAIIDNLIADGTINGPFADFLKDKLPKGLSLFDSSTQLVLSINSWPPANKQDVIAGIKALTKFLTDTRAEGLLKFGHQASMSRIDGILTGLNIALAIVEGLLEGSTQPTDQAVHDAAIAIQHQADEIDRYIGELRADGE